MRPSSGRKTQRLRGEALEPRHLLAGVPVISEFMAINDSISPDEDGEYTDWIEIHNPDPSPLDLTGWHLTDDASQLDHWQFPAVTLQPNQYLVVRASGLDRPGNGPNGELHTDFRLSGDGEYLALVAPTGQTVVQEFDSVGGGYPAQVADVSYGLVSGSTDETYFLAPSPGAANGGPTTGNPRGRVVFSEIMYHPDSLSDAEEYVELYNAGTDSLDLSGWKLTAGVAYEFPNGASLAAGAYLVVAADRATFVNKYPEVPTGVVFGGWQGRLSNSSEKIAIENATGDLVDQVTYADEGDWGQRTQGALQACCRGWVWTASHDARGYSLELINVVLSNDEGQNWSGSLVEQGTPGAENSVRSADIAPMILDVNQSIAIPRSSEEVSIRATLRDEVSSTLLNASLFYRVDNSQSPDDPNPFMSLAMMDDGLHDDAASDDGIFGATIPALPDGTVVEFYVLANDPSFNYRAWPAPTRMVDGSMLQTANALYQVNDEFDRTYAPGDQPTISVIMTEEERKHREEITYSNAEMNATIIVVDGTDTDVRYLAGVRNRGNSSRLAVPRNHRINLPSDRPLNGIDAIPINSVETHSQLLGSVIFQAAGVVAENARAVELRINGVDLAMGDSMSGSYVQLEVPNSDFASNHFPGDSNGNVYSVRKVVGALAELQYEGDDPDTYRSRYQKTTNVDEDDFSDLIGLLDALNNSSDEDFYAEVSVRVDLEQWFRYFATDAFLNNAEGGLATGGGDDYSLYRGLEDTRFKLIPHDLDTLLSRGLGVGNARRDIFIYQNVIGLERLFTHPATAGLYYKHLLDLGNSLFTDEQFGAYVDQALGSWVSNTTVQNYKNAAKARRDYILSQIPIELTVGTTIPTIGDRELPQTTSGRVVLSGQSHPARTRSVMVNGVEATWIARYAIWALPPLALNPGLNRVLVQAFDGVGGTGSLVDVTSIDIWNDQNPLSEIASIGPQDETWDAASGPYHVTQDVTVPSGTTLTIEPGTSVFFEAGVELRVEGTLVARGTEFNRIRFSSLPGADFVPDVPRGVALPDGSPRWGGIRFVDSMVEENIIAYADIEFAQDNVSNQGSIGVIRSQAVLDNLTFAGTHLRVLYGSSPSWIVSNSIFPDLFAEGEFADALNLDNVTEHITSIGTVPDGGRYIIRNNVFGATKGHNDVIDATSGRRADGDAIVQIIDNVFTGGGDELLDLGGDVYVAGNLFMNVFKDDETSDRGYANAISTGDAGGSSTIGVVRNIFWDVDHAINLKRGTATLFENNTVVNVHPDFVDVHGNPNVGSAVNLYVDEPAATTGEGAYLSGNLFSDAPRIFGNADSIGSMSQLQLIHNFIDPLLAMTTIGARPGTVLDAGEGNLVDAVHFVDEANGDFRLADGSRARGTGPFGMDFGAMVPAGVWVAGAPATVTDSTSVELTFGGPGIMAFRYRVNGEPWSVEIPIGTGFAFGDVEATVRSATGRLDGLSDGQYTVEVVGKDFAGNWQAESEATTVSWTVDTTNPLPFNVVINEVLVVNEAAFDLNGTRPDAIELFNRGAADVDLGGYALSDDIGRPSRFVFPNGTVVGAGEYLVVFADSDQPVGNELHLGFGLKQEGEGVYLFDWAGRVPGQPIVPIDSVEFGSQLADLSIARLPGVGWGLAVPTLGSSNMSHPLSSPSDAVINEWLTSGGGDDFVELYNTSDVPIDVGGLFLTDDPIGEPDKHRIAPLSFIEPGGFAVFQADGNVRLGPEHVGFKLAAERGWIALLAEDLRTLNSVFYGQQMSDVSQGRVPDGGERYEFTRPSPNDTADVFADFDRNGVVEVADYDFWRSTFGSVVVPGAAADGSWDGVVNAADFTIWRDAYDAVLATAVGVPDETTSADSDPSEGIVDDISWYHNAELPENVDGDPDRIVSAIDALLVINELTSRTFSDPVTGRLESVGDIDAQRWFYDVNNDGNVSPLDAVRVINSIKLLIEKRDDGKEISTSIPKTASQFSTRSPQVRAGWQSGSLEEEEETEAPKDAILADLVLLDW